jgi:Protein of unknown function (DUF1553)/Protein of unknown function (DUF1549)
VLVQKIIEIGKNRLIRKGDAAMNRAPLWMLPAALAAALAAWPAPAADPPPDKEAGAELALARRIDQHLADAWKAAGVEPAPVADDAEFCRRVYLDVAGRIPSVTEARTFLDDTRADKRQRLVDQLLASPRYATHFTNVWRSLLLPEAGTNLQIGIQANSFTGWLHKHLARNTPYDEMVRELLTAPIDGNRGPQLALAGGGQADNPLLFYFAKEFKPENLAGATSRIFLGVKLECAQCHDHPFARWKRDQFWSYAAFFAGLQRQNNGGDFVVPGREIADRRELAIPGTDRVAQAKYLDGSEPKWQTKVSSRETLANWMTAADNPYFARAAVNRLWGYLVGTGIIDPVDDMVGGETKASHPEVLDLLAREFVAHHYDLKFLIRAIVNTQAYQLSSSVTHGGSDDPRVFARMPLRGLSGEQIVDSVSVATGYQEATVNEFRPAVIFNNGSLATELKAKFNNQTDKPTEHTTSILQALALMNGKLVADATTLERSELLAAVVDAPFLDTRGRLEVLYLATVSRRPQPKELERLVRYVDGGAAEDTTRKLTQAEKDKQYHQALADVFWALLNSGEFMLNH